MAVRRRQSLGWATIKLAIAIRVMQMSSAMNVPKIAISAICSAKWRMKYQ